MTVIICITLMLIIVGGICSLFDIACETVKARSEARYNARKTAYRIRAYENIASRADSVEGRARALAISYSLRGDGNG